MLHEEHLLALPSVHPSIIIPPRCLLAATGRDASAVAAHFLEFSRAVPLDKKTSVHELEVI